MQILNIYVWFFNFHDLIKKDCYKVILDCNEEVKNVYNRSGFEEKGMQMGIYFYSSRV